MSGGVVIIGAGQAGFQCAFSLRAEGFDGPVTIVGDESSLPYQRPPLSKGVLSGKQDIDAIDLRPAAYYEDNHIALRMGSRALSIDRAGQRVLLAQGGELPYDHLVLATGCRNRQLTIPGAGEAGVCYLRTKDDAALLLTRLETVQNIVVIGGGFIGLEVAAACASHGMKVTVVEPQTRLMQRAVGPIISEFYRDLHARHDVRILFGVAPLELTGAGVRLNNGDLLPADLIVAGIGVIPTAELAEAAGLAVANGIVVDEFLRTNDPAIFAIGDCASYPSPFAGGMIRLESVQNAVDQARCVAASVCGKPEPFNAVPWFWTDQFDAKLQMVGLSKDFDTQILRGDVAAGKFSVCYFRGGRLIAIDSLNRPGDHLAGRKLLAAANSLTPGQAADLNFDLKSALPA